MTAKITIKTVAREPWVETSPTDPTTATLTAVATTQVNSLDDGPWTVSFPACNTFGVVQKGQGETVTATVSLDSQGAVFSVNVQQVG